MTRAEALTPMTAGTTIMGVINVTPDSFYDGGDVVTPEAVCARAADMIEAGADCIDIGGESSRPGAKPIGLEAELQRVVPAFEALTDVGVPLSVDTYRAETARRCLELGAAIVNDITGLRGDPAMIDAIAGSDCRYVLMHMQGTPETMQDAPVYDDVVDTVTAFFESQLDLLARRGVARARCILDPGFGFGKTVEHNLSLLRRLSEFRQFGCPILIGTSNKSTIGRILGAPVDDRREGTAATVALGIANGADIVRVHDVKAMARVARMTDAILAAP